jgi:alpha/beta superfamily hydrolase
MDTEELWLTAADGVRLEAELAVPEEPQGAVVLCHPHPEHGGTMRSIVTGALFRDLPKRHVACLRFNFRGVEQSGGSHEHGRGEQDDIVAAIATLHDIVEGLPLVVSGWSFGADTSLAVLDERIGAWAPVAPTLRAGDPPAAHDPRPKALLVPEHDEYNPPDRAREAVKDWTATTVTVVPGADHFLVGRTDAATDHVIHVMDALGRTA